MSSRIDTVFEDENIYFSYVKTDKVDLVGFPDEPHIHNICELIFFKKGDATYTVEGREYKLSKNTLIISRAGDRHMIRFKEAGAYERYNVFFDERNVPFDLYKKIPPKLDTINFDGNSFICDLFKRFNFYCEHFEGESLSRILCSLVEEIFYNIKIAIDDMGDSEYSVASVNPFITAALSYIENNLTSNISVDDICNELYVTNSHLHHLFVTHLQISPKKYILSKRLELARRGIRSGQKPIEACMQSGFLDYSTFYRDYKKTYGYSPSQELELGLKKNIAHS